MHPHREPILTSGFPLGSSAGLVVAFEWLGQPYRITRVDMIGEMREEAYKRLNGRAETPVLITSEGRVLTETMAIALWLEARDTERRISFEPGTPESDRLHQYVAFLNTSFTNAFAILWVALEAKGASDSERDTLRKYGCYFVAKRHEQLEAMIGDRAYLLGDKPTLADAVFVGVARWAEFHQAIDPHAYPRTLALRKRLEADPAFSFALAVEEGRPAVGTGAMQGLVPLQNVLRDVA